MTASIGCTAEVPGDGVDEDDPRAALKGQFQRDVQPLLEATCAQCHAGSREFIDFMAPQPPEFPGMYERVINWPSLVNVEDAGQSRMVTKGQHEGRAWTLEELNLINPWLAAEAEFGSSGEEIDTTEVTPLNGRNTHDLGDLGIPEGAGCSISYNYTRSDPVIYLDDLKIFDEATGDGCVLESPVVGVVLDAGTFYDPNNNFSDVTVDIGPGDVDGQLIGGGLLIVSWLDGNDLGNTGTVRLKFRFFGVESTGTGGGTQAGAQLVDYFYDNVVTNCIQGLSTGAGLCRNCHGPGGGNQGSLNLAFIDSVDETERQQQANEIYARSDRVDPTVPGGDAWLEFVSPGGPHPQGLAAQGDIDNCATIVSQWMTMETQ